MTRIQLKNKPQNLEDREQRLQHLSLHTKTALEAMTVAELRELAAFLIPNARKLRKPEFIQAILDITEPYRSERLQKTVAAIELMGDIDITPEMVRDGHSNGLNPKQVSEILINKLESGNYSESTIAKTKTKQIRKILEQLSLENPDTQGWNDELYGYVREYAAKHHHAVNQEYNQKIEDGGTGETMVEVNGSKIISWATEIIDWALDQPNLDKGWHKVSFALAITSGRRMDEIHGDKSSFRAIDSNTLETTGLSKKADDDFVLESPCLVDAHKWVAVHQKLPAKRLNQTNAVVNGVISRAISESLKPKSGESLIYEFFGLPVDGFKPSYKTARDFYVSYLIATQYNRRQHGTEISYAKSLLGHSAKKQTLSYSKLIVI